AASPVIHERSVAFFKASTSNRRCGYKLAAWNWKDRGARQIGRCEMWSPFPLTIFRLFENAVDRVPLNSTKRWVIVVFTAAPVCGYSLLWNVSIVNYYSMISDPEKLASFVAPEARALEHLLLFPCLVVLYYVASGAWWTSGRAALIVFKQLMLVVLFGLLVRPAVYL